MVLLRFSDRAVGLVSLAVLARLLLPEDFGLIALALSMIALIEMFGEFGVELALIKNQQAQRRHYDSAWTFNIITAALLAGILFAIAIPAADFFEEPRIASVIRWLALANVIAALANIGVVDFRKNLELSREFRWLFSSRIIGTVFTLALAFYWRDYWALVAGTLAQAALRTSLSYFVHDYRPRWSFAAIGEIFHFSKWVLVQNVINGLNERSPAIILGRVADANAVAHFSVSHEISSLATTEIAAPIRRAVFPGFAKMASDLAVLRQGFLRTFALMMLIGLPVPVGIALTAPLIVPVFLGGKWLAAIPLIQVLSLNGIMRSLGTSGHIVYLAIGKPRITAQLAVLRLALLLPLLIFGAIKAGALGAAWALVATSLVMWVTDIAVLFRVLRLETSELIASAWRPVLAAGTMALVVLSLYTFLPAPQELSDFVSHLFLSIAGGAFVYCSMLLGLWRASGSPVGAESIIIAAVWEKLSPPQHAA